MQLKCKATCVKIHKKSQSPAFLNLRYGDIIEFSVEIKRAGNASRGTKATYVRCYNPQTDKISELSFNQIMRVLDNFDFVEVEDIKSISCGMGYSLQDNGMPPIRCHMDEAPQFCKDCIEYIVD